MAEASRELVVLMTRGTDHELSSVAFTIANGGITSGLKVYVFLTSAAVDLVRKQAVKLTHVPPLEPLQALMEEPLQVNPTQKITPHLWYAEEAEEAAVFYAPISSGPARRSRRECRRCGCRVGGCIRPPSSGR